MQCISHVHVTKRERDKDRDRERRRKLSRNYKIYKFTTETEKKCVIKAAVDVNEARGSIMRPGELMALFAI